MWIEKDLDLFVDISTMCNAGCPVCHRTKPGTTETAEWLREFTWSIEDVKNSYKKDFLKNYVAQAQICGTWGDPFMVKDISQIIDYFLEDTTLKILLNTNGSLRDEQFWWELGVQSRNTGRIRVVFDIDGIDQEMHSLYRQKTSLNKILNNMDAYVEGGGKAQTFTVVFKHNEKYLKQIEQLCKKHGSTYHMTVLNERWYEFKGKNLWKFIDNEGKTQQLDKYVMYQKVWTANPI